MQYLACWLELVIGLLATHVVHAYWLELQSWIVSHTCDIDLLVGVALPHMQYLACWLELIIGLLVTRDIDLLVGVALLDC